MAESRLRAVIRITRNWLASLRVRLIVTYVFITVLSFAFLFVLLTQLVQEFMLKRETDLLKFSARTLGTTIRSPLEANDQDFARDLYWTQRRCRLYLHDEIPDLHVRVLNGQGYVLTDSDVSMEEWAKWCQQIRPALPSLANRLEVRQAIATRRTQPYNNSILLEDNLGNLTSDTLHLAMPFIRPNAKTKKSEIAFIMYLERPVGPVIEDMREMQQRIKITLLTSLLLTILVSILLAGNLVAGLNSATRIARSFARGDLSQRMRERGRDEVGQLGAAFNQMADSLQRQEQLRRDLLADVSHELRTPLTAIAGCADTLADGTLQEDSAATERFLGIIVRESERMQRLVSDILELSRLQSGSVEIRREPLPIIPLINDAVEIARLHARQEGISIVWAPAENSDQPLVMGHEDRLAQALRNLLDNARHHTPAGRSIFVSLDENGSTITVRVRDEGEGIPPEDLPWVFDRFYRAGKGLMKKGGGTGLGLAIVREIMQAHQGQVTVQSVVGQGTTFSLHLPRAQAEPQTTLKALILP